MIKTGLVSVTFRNLTPIDIVDLVKKAGLHGIEWGGDIHVPHGNIARANEVACITKEAGLHVISYGSYYKVGCEDNPTPFEMVLETAVALHAPTIRVWAGDRGTERADEVIWKKVVDESRRISMLAASARINLAFEYHEDTLTDTSKSACRLMQAINHPNMFCYWQPPMDLDFDDRYRGLREISPWLSNLHVFNQSGEHPEPLAEGVVEWAKYIEFVKQLPGDRNCLIEFVKNDSPAQFLLDAEALKSICSN
jgi:3-dehydroshikimate dehydratase